MFQDFFWCEVPGIPRFSLTSDHENRSVCLLPCKTQLFEQLGDQDTCMKLAWHRRWTLVPGICSCLSSDTGVKLIHLSVPVSSGSSCDVAWSSLAAFMQHIRKMFLSHLHRHGRGMKKKGDDKTPGESDRKTSFLIPLSSLTELASSGDAFR